MKEVDLAIIKIIVLMIEAVKKSRRACFWLNMLFDALSWMINQLKLFCNWNYFAAESSCQHGKTFFKDGLALNLNLQVYGSRFYKY